MIPLLTLALRDENDVVVARQRARQLARHLGFDAQDQARVATAVSELARNVIQYAGRGRIEFALEGRTPPRSSWRSTSATRAPASPTST